MQHRRTGLPVYGANGKMRFQSFFMLMTVQPFFFASAISASLNVPICESRAVGELAHGVVMMHEHHQPRAAAGLRPFQHLPVAVRVAEGGDGPAPNMRR